VVSAAKYLQIMDHMKRLIRAAGKKHYTFVVGKLNPHKLANFEHIDVFVLVACPGTTTIIITMVVRCARPCTNT
jgi:diphthamide biosynthesis protein 2